MMKITHFSSGLLLSTLFPDKAPYILLGSLLPDLDLKFYHRALFHNIFFLLALLYISPYLFLGASLHVLLDSLTKRGVSLLFPFSSRSFGLKLTTTGSLLDYFLFFLFTALTLYLFLNPSNLTILYS